MQNHSHYILLYWFSRDGKKQLVIDFEIGNWISQLNIGTGTSDSRAGGGEPAEPLLYPWALAAPSCQWCGVGQGRTGRLHFDIS